MAKQTVPEKVLLDGARMSIYALIAGTMGFLKKNKIPIKNWISYIGDQFDGSLADLEGEDKATVLEHLLTLQLMPLGVEVLNSRATRQKAEATVTSLPAEKILEKFGTTPKEMLKGFGITPQDFDNIFDMHVPAAKSIGLKLAHSSSGGKKIITLE